MQLPTSAPYEEMELSRNSSSIPSIAKRSCNECCVFTLEILFRCMGLKTKRKERPLRNRTQNVVYQYQAAPTSSASCSPTSRSAENSPCPSDFEQGRLLPKTQELSAPIGLHRDLEPEFHDVSAALEVGTTSDSLMDAPVSIPLPTASTGSALGPIASPSSSSSTLPGSLHLHNSSSSTNPSKSYHAFSTPSSSSTIYRRGSSAEQPSTSSSGVVGCEGGGGGGNGGGSDNGGNAGNERGGRGGGLGGGLVGGLVGGFFTTNYISSHPSSSAVHSSISTSSSSSSSHCQISSAKRIQKNPSRKGRIADKLGWKSRADPNSPFGSTTVSSSTATALSSSPSPSALAAMPSTAASASESKIEHGSGNVLYTNVMITTLHSSNNNNLNADDSNNSNSNSSNNGEANYGGSSGSLIGITLNNNGSKKEYERDKGGAMTIASRQQTRLPLASNNLLNKIAAAAGLKIVGDVDEDDDSDLCPTCLDPYSELNPKYVTVCGHGFHLQCLLEWKERKNTCPLCEAPVRVLGFDF